MELQRLLPDGNALPSDRPHAKTESLARHAAPLRSLRAMVQLEIRQTRASVRTPVCIGPHQTRLTSARSAPIRRVEPGPRAALRPPHAMEMGELPRALRPRAAGRLSGPRRRSRAVQRPAASRTGRLQEIRARG